MDLKKKSTGKFVWVTVLSVSIVLGIYGGVCAQTSNCGAVPPNIFFLIDDSGSMDLEFIINDPYIEDSDGRWQSESGIVSYLYDNGDNHYPQNDPYGRVLGVNHDTRAKWKATWSGYNKMYYDPKRYYEPWITHTGDPMPDADPVAPRSNPMIPDHVMELDALWVALEMAEYHGIIINDLDADYYESGTWYSSEGLYPYEGGSRYTDAAGSSATWEYDFRRDEGLYYAEAWVSCHADRDTAAQYEIWHSGAGSPLIVTMDQRGTNPVDPPDSDRGCGKWVRLSPDPIQFDRFAIGSVTVTRMDTSGGHGDSTCADAIRFITEQDWLDEQAIMADMTTNIPNAHYYTWHDANTNGLTDDGEIWLVVPGQAGTTYYQVSPIPSDGVITPHNLAKTAESSVPENVRADYYNQDWPGGHTARQNFANWFQYHRRRWMACVYALSKAINELSGAHVGMAGINAVLPNSPEGLGIVEPVRPVRVGGQDQSDILLNALFNYDFIDGYTATPLRMGYNEVGEYFDTQVNDPANKLGTSPIDADGGRSQLNFMVVLTDGFYNGRSAVPGNIDATTVFAENGVEISGCPPFRDDAVSTFADLAMQYYAFDIAPDVDDEVPIWLGTPPDYVTWQHLNTYVHAFGIPGTLNPDDYDLYGNPGVYPEWPNRIIYETQHVDDMYHGAVNGRGEFFNPMTPEALANSFLDLVDIIGPVTGPACIASPAPGSTLDSTSVAFTWNDTGAEKYWLHIGVSPGTDELYSKDQGTNTSAVVSGLPGNGEPIYVRLWSRIDGEWRFVTDCAYSALDAGMMTAMIAEPECGTALSSATVTFTWNDTGAEKYWLAIGSSPGGNDLYNEDQSTNTSAVVSGLPGNGETLHVRLWSKVDGEWLYDTECTYTAVDSGALIAEIQSPAAGATFSSATETFTWNDTSAEKYWLFVGTSAGGNDLYSKDQATGTSAVVSGLPNGGETVYVRLWSKVDGEWLYGTDCTYTAFDSGAMVAEIQSPAPGTTFSSTTATFTWNDTGAEKYWLWVGTSAGGNELHNKGYTTASATVSGLPSAGENVYVRLWSRIDGEWLYAGDCTYTAAGP